MFFDTFFTYGEAGPPAYIVFRDVDYKNEHNLEVMANISIAMSELNNTVIAPIYSWITPFSNFIKGGDWNETCGTP